MKAKRHAVVVGFPYYAKFLATLMNEHSDHWEMRAFGEQRWDTLRALFALRKADALICFGGPAPDAALAEAARRSGAQVVVVWAGSDVIQARENPQDLQVIKEERFHHISDGPWLIDELAVLGLRAEYEPLTAVEPGGPLKPFPSAFRVLTYLPEPRRDFYGARAVYEVARRMPDVPFTVVGHGGRSDDAPPNVEFCGYVNDMRDRLDDATVLLRLPEHDGKSMLVLETLARGRHVVWNYEFPHVRTARSVDEVLEQLQQLRCAFDAGTLPLNEEGREYVLRTFNREQTAARLEARLDGLTGTVAETRPPTRKRVAVSGLSIFCADVANYARSIVPEWQVDLLRTNSRFEILTSMFKLSACDVWYSIGNPATDRWLAVAARILRKPRVIHWVGSDILILAEQPHFRKVLSARTMMHLAEATWTAQELQQYGLTPRIVPLPPRRHHGSTLPLPAKFTVMLYLPRTRAEFYGRSAFEQLMRNLRDKPVRYVIVGGGDLDVPAGVDAQNLGWRNDLRDAYKDVTVLVRFTAHDGLSLMVLEALSYGRHVVWTQPFPFVRQVHDYAAMERAILDLLQAHERGALQPQDDASAAIRRHYSPAVCVSALAQAWDDASRSAIAPVPVGQTP